MDLHNDAVFEAEAEVDQGRRRKSSKTLAEDTVTAANGGADIGRVHTQDENSPLLNNGDSPGDGGGSVGAGYEWIGKDDFEGLPWYKTPSIFWLLGPFLLSALAFGGIIVPKLNLILSLICREYMADQAIHNPGFTPLPVLFAGEDNPECRALPEIQKRVAEFTLYGNLISGLLSAVVSPKLGALSDRYGRKRLMVITNMGMLLGEVITIVAANYPETFPVNWILFGFVFDGLCGSFITSMALSHSYATDCTHPAKRAVSFAYFHGCLFTGIAVGPIAAGYVIKLTGSILSMFYIVLGCHLFFIFFLLAFIPESLSKARQHAAREKHREDLNQAGPAADWINQIRSFNLLEPLKILWPTGPGTSPTLRRNLVLLAAIDTIIFGVAMGAMAVVVLYIGYEFNWGTYESSRFVSIVNTCRVLALIVFLPLITRLVRGPSSKRRIRNSGSDPFDLNVIRFAILCDTLGFLGYTLARSGNLFILSGALASIGGVGSPTLQSALTKHVPQDRIGQLLGASGLLHALARVVAPTIFNGIYSVTVGKFTQTVFVSLTATFAVALGFSWFVRPHVYLDEQHEDDPSERPEQPSPDLLSEEEERFL